MALAPALMVSLAACRPSETPTDTPDPTGETGTPTPTVPTGTTGDTGGPPPPAPLELCINEVLPGNATALAGDDGTYPDWFELHNPGTEAVDLAGWVVTDADRSYLLDGGSVPPGGFLVLFADGGSQPGHVPFQLDAGGEELGLYAPDGRGSVVEWDVLESDVALARRTDCCAGEGCWTAVPRGSPGATNAGPVLVETAALATGATFAHWPGLGSSSEEWADPDYDDQAWPRGPAPLGYGGDEATEVFHGPAAFLRAPFHVAAAPVSAVLRLRRDDGVIVYLDGVELLRDNVAAGPLVPTTRADQAVEGAGEVVWIDHRLDPAPFTAGDHLLAVAVVQGVPDGADLLLDAELLLGTWSEP